MQMAGNSCASSNLSEMASHGMAHLCVTFLRCESHLPHTHKRLSQGGTEILLKNNAVSTVLYFQGESVHQQYQYLLKELLCKLWLHTSMSVMHPCLLNHHLGSGDYHLALQNTVFVSGNIISEHFRGQTREIWQLVRQMYPRRL